MRVAGICGKDSRGFVAEKQDITALPSFCFLASSMPGISSSMPLSDALHPSSPAAVDGPIARAADALAQLCAKQGGRPHKEDSGRPRVGEDVLQPLPWRRLGGGRAAPRPIGIDVEAESDRCNGSAPLLWANSTSRSLDCFGDGARHPVPVVDGQRSRLQGLRDGRGLPDRVGMGRGDRNRRPHSSPGNTVPSWTCIGSLDRHGDRPVWLAVASRDRAIEKKAPHGGRL